MALTAVEIARWDGAHVVIRPGGVRVRWELIDLTSSDGHALRAVFSAAVQALGDPAERKMLEEAFLLRAPAVTSADVSAYFMSALESCARRQSDLSDVQTLLADAGKAVLISRLIDAARAVAFGCGLELLPPFEFELDSPTFRARQQEQRRAAAQTERLSRAADIFKQFEEIRRAAPELPADKILQRMGLADPAEQTELLRSLLMAAANQAQPSPLWAVAGPHLIRIEPDALENGPTPRAIIFSPPSACGPFRSVQRGQLEGISMLLLGARSGVLLVDPRTPEQAALYADAAITSSLGFNAACICGGRLWATHGDAGLIGWELSRPNEPVTAIRPDASQLAANAPFSPRNLCACGENRLVFSSDRRLFELAEDGTAREVENDSPSPIIAIVAHDRDFLLLIREDGVICRHEMETLKIVSCSRRAGRLVAAGGLPWLGSVRILLAPEQGPVLCVGMDDEMVTQYVSSHGGLRLTAAAADRVAAVSADRQRILLWPSWDGRRPPAEIHVAAIAKHRVADVEFA